MAEAHGRKMTYEEYVVLERASEDRHEFIDGAVVSRTRTGAVHNEVAGNASALLWNAVRGRGCTVLGSNQRIRTPAGTAHYPDVSVLRGEPQLSDALRDELLNPALIVEVLSESTEAYDRGKKFERYATIPSFQAYLLVASDRQSLELRERREDVWTLRTFGPGERLAIQALDVTLAVDDVYAGVQLVDPKAAKN